MNYQQNFYSILVVGHNDNSCLGIFCELRGHIGESQIPEYPDKHVGDRGSPNTSMDYFLHTDSGGLGEFLKLNIEKII